MLVVVPYVSLAFRSASSDELGIHMTTHMDERLFPCDKCGGKFASETRQLQSP